MGVGYQLLQLLVQCAFLSIEELATYLILAVAYARNHVAMGPGIAVIFHAANINVFTLIEKFLKLLFCCVK